MTTVKPMKKFTKESSHTLLAQTEVKQASDALTTVESLPTEVLTSIVSHLPPRRQLIIRRVCRTFRDVVAQPAMQMALFLQSEPKNDIVWTYDQAEQSVTESRGLHAPPVTIRSRSFEPFERYDQAVDEVQISSKIVRVNRL